MRKFILYVTVFIITQSCFVYKKPNNEIIGKWCLLNKYQLNYPKINFYKDSIAIFESKMDTVYSYKYYLKGKWLYLIQPNGRENKNKILFINKDSLVFTSLIENKNKQVYKRCFN